MKGTPHHVRWLIRRDDPVCQAIDPTLTEEDLRDVHCFGRLCGNVVEDERGLVAGFMLYRLGQTSVELVRMAVLVTGRRRGAGRAMVERLVRKVRKSQEFEGAKRALDCVVADVPEDNLHAQLFLRACGFRATHVDRGDPTTFHFELWPEKEADCAGRGDHIVLLD